jgi:hypothetical protein
MDTLQYWRSLLGGQDTRDISWAMPQKANVVVTLSINPAQRRTERGEAEMYLYEPASHPTTPSLVFLPQIRLEGEINPPSSPPSTIKHT